jgi:ribosome-associated translation inhibitor RaiA
MPIPVTVTFRDMPPSPSVDAFTRRWANRLERVDARIQHCDVVIDQPHRHHEHGRRFRVQVVITIPGREIAVSQEPGEDGAHEDVRVAVRDSFRAARRQLEDHVRRTRAHRAA